MAIDVVPTGQASPSPLNVSDEGSGLMMNEITQTDNADILPIFCTHEVQTDSFVESKEVQTFVSEMMTTESQTECQVMEKSMQTEIEVTTEEKENQTEKNNQDQSMQTKIEVPTEEKENQTEKNNQDQSIQTEIEVTTEEKSNETEINNSNILTVNRIELVEEMYSCGTQTDVSELESMDPITPVQCLVPADYVEQLNAQVKENVSETDSVVSSASKLEVSLAAKLEVTSQRQTTSAGLDMRMGKYHELDFPPVSSMNVALKHMDTVVKERERTPSPEDLCTRLDVSPLKKKKVKISPEKLPAACTISEDPRAVLQHVEKRVKTSVNLTPAHKPSPAPSISPKARDMTSPVQLTGNGKSPCTEQAMTREWSKNFNTSSGAIEALNCHEGLTSSNRQRNEGQHHFATSTPLRHSTLFAGNTLLTASGAPRNVFSSLQTQRPLLARRPTGSCDFSSPFRFGGWDKKLSAGQFPQNTSMNKDRELVSWNNTMLQMLPSKDQESRKRQYEESNTDSGIISDVMDVEQASGEHTGTSDEVSFNLRYGLEMSNKHPLAAEEDLSPDECNYGQIEIDSDVEEELLAENDISNDGSVHTDTVNISVDFKTSS